MTFLLPLLAVFQFAATSKPHVARRELPHITANDNRTPAGVLRGGVLTLRLVAQDGLFFPDGENGSSIVLQAFGEEDKAPSSSAPLIRVPAGTEVRVTVRNGLAMPLAMRGLFDRAAAPDSAELAPAASREFKFLASVPGTYFYWGRTTKTPTSVGAGEDSQLLGAFIVDPPKGAGHPVSDRVMVITNWFKPADTRKPDVKPLELITVNGRSWPFTERLEYAVGDSIHWRVINGTFIDHPMHLHGFYYRVDSRGTALSDSVYTAPQRRTAVTELMRPGTTMAMAWSPTRPGNWLFHCHLVFHIDSDLRLTPAAEHAEGHQMNHATDGMAGLVMGIVVKPRPGQRLAERQDAQPPEKKLRLYVNSKPNVFGTKPGFAFVLQEGPNPPAPDSIRVPGTTIQLVRGERTQITVVNRAPVAVTVHWHGIELESYYDGVAGWSGENARTAPMIAPNDSFIVRMTPDRAGTFIYHTHADESGQLSSGLYGPLLITERGEPIDTATNKVFLLGLGGPTDDSPPWVNGSASPGPIILDAGRTYRFRLINISPNGFEVVKLVFDSVVQQWRAFAKDGATLPAWQATMRAATVRMGPGETNDFEFTPSKTGEFVLDVRLSSLGVKPKTVLQPIVVKPRGP